MNAARNLPVSITPQSRPGAKPVPSVSNQSCDYSFMVDQLSEDKVKSLLSELARTNPAVGSAVMRAYESIGPAAQIDDHEAPNIANPTTTPAPVYIDFDHYSESVWRTLVSYGQKSCSRQFTLSFDAIGDVESYLAAIAKQTPKESLFDTKRSALETIQKITELLLLTREVLGRQIRNQFLAFSRTIPDIMIKILCGMTSAERIIIGNSQDEVGTFTSKVEWLRDEAKSYSLDALDDLDTVVKLLAG